LSGIEAVVPLEHETLGERVYDQLREMLIAGQFAPGERITLRTLAAALGTSVMPVRDALRQLMVGNAIELLPSRVFRVPVMSRTRFLELRDIRLTVEGLAVGRAAALMTSGELSAAARISTDFNKECDSRAPDPAKLIVLNKELHFTIYRAARMPALLQIIEGLWTQIGPVLNLDVRTGSERISNKIPCEHHERLVKALRAKDSVAAQEALAADLNSACAYILAQNRLQP